MEYENYGEKFMEELKIDSSEYTNYFNKVGEKFSISGKELVGYLMHNFTVENYDDLSLMMQRIEGLGDIVNGFEYDPDTPASRLQMWDTAGQNRFADFLQKGTAVSGGAIYGMAFSDITRHLRTLDTLIDYYNDTQRNFYIKHLPKNYHTLVLVKTHLDSLIDLEDKEGSIKRINNKYSIDQDERKGEFFLKRAKKVFTREYVNEEWNKSFNMLKKILPWNNVKKSVEEYLGSEEDSEFTKEIFSFKEWNDFIYNSNMWEDFYDLSKRLSFITEDPSHNSEITSLLQNIGNLMNWNKLIETDEVGESNIIGTIMTSARPCLDFVNCRLFPLLLRYVMDMQDMGHLGGAAKSVMYGSGGAGKTANLRANQHLIEGLTWYNLTLTVAPDIYSVKIKKELFYIDGEVREDNLDLKLFSEMAGSIFPEKFGIKIKNTESHPDKGFYYRAERLIEMKESWKNSVGEKLEKCSSFEDFEKTFGVTKKAISTAVEKVGSRQKVLRNVAKSLLMPKEKLNNFFQEYF